MKPFLSTIGLGSFLCLIVTTTAHALQFCEVNAIEQSNWCLALNSYHNVTSEGDDFYITMSAHFPAGQGWLGVGSGYIMHQSLMFVMYPGTTKGSVVLGARSTDYHTPPRGIKTINPSVHVVNTTLTADGYHVANFICYSCTHWGGNRLSTASISQPWIWATNPNQSIESDEPDKPLERHEYYGIFYMNMQTSHSTSTTTEANFPDISPERTSIAAGPKAEGHSPPSNARRDALLLHGLLLLLTFALLFPAGVYAALPTHRWPSVKTHRNIQIGTLCTALLGIGLAISHAGLRSLGGLHQLLGMAVGAGLVIQGYLGYSHHRAFLAAREHGRAPGGERLLGFHRYLGRGVYCVGVGNAAFGLSLRHSGGYPLAWLVVVAGQVMAYCVLVSRSKRTRAEKVEMGYTYGRVDGSDSVEA